jgi:hypothetical protein
MDPEKDKKRKKKVKTIAVKLPDEVVSQYESILAQVRRVTLSGCDVFVILLYTLAG